MAKLPENGKKTRFSGARAAECGRKGGLAAQKRARESAAVDRILSLAIRSGDIDSVEDVQNLAELDGANLTVEAAMIAVQIKKAIKGDTRAWDSIMRYQDKKMKQAAELEALQLENERLRMTIEALKKSLGSDSPEDSKVTVVIDV